jgi:hypothetical protein
VAGFLAVHTLILSIVVFLSASGQSGGHHRGFGFGDLGCWRFTSGQDLGKVVGL